MTICSAVFIQYQRVTDRQTDISSMLTRDKKYLTCAQQVTESLFIVRTGTELKGMTEKPKENRC